MSDATLPVPCPAAPPGPRRITPQPLPPAASPTQHSGILQQQALPKGELVATTQQKQAYYTLTHHLGLALVASSLAC